MMSQLDMAPETELVQPAAWKDGPPRRRNGRGAGGEGGAEAKAADGSNHGVGDGLRAEQQGLRDSQASLLCWKAGW